MDIASFIISAIEILGTIAFSLSGTLVGIDRGLDFFGVIVLGCATSVGGGILRDILLGKTPPTAFMDPKYVAIAFVASFIAILISKHYIKYATPEKLKAFMVAIGVFDAMGLGMFTVIGMNAAISMGYTDNLFLLIFIGVMTGVGGGVMRDVFVHKTPIIFKKDIYATAAIIGGLCYYYSLKLGFLQITSMMIGAGVIIAIRFVSMYYDLNLPKFEQGHFD